jgi:hypothetical protein
MEGLRSVAVGSEKRGELEAVGTEGRGEEEACGEGEPLALPEGEPLPAALRETEGVAEGELEAEPLPAALREALLVCVGAPVPRGEADEEAQREAVAEAEGERPALALAPPLRLPPALRDADSDAVCERVGGALRLTEGVAVGEPVPTPLRLAAVTLREALPVALPEAVASRALPLGEPDSEGVADADADSDAQAEGVAVAQPEADAELERLPVAVRLALPLAEGDAVAPAVPEALGVEGALRVGVGDAEADSDKVDEADGLAVRRGVTVRVPLDDALRDAAALRVPERVASGDGLLLAEAEAVFEEEGVGDCAAAVRNKRMVSNSISWWEWKRGGRIAAAPFARLQPNPT